MKPKGLGELCAAISDLANQTGTEKKDVLIIHQGWTLTFSVRGPDQMLGAQPIFKVPDIYVCN